MDTRFWRTAATALMVVVMAGSVAQAVPVGPDLGFDPEMMNGLFMIARTPGLVAHVREEQTRMKPMRMIEPANHTYDGPHARSHR